MEEKIKISFVDKTHEKVVADITFKEKENKKLCFSMSGQYNDHTGQCFDTVKSRTKAQKRLINIWKEYHLNDMNSGTEEQEQALKDFKGDYDAQCEFLKQKGLYKVTLSDGTKYKYGTAWLHRELPLNLLEEVKQLCATINKEEEEHKQQIIKNSTIKSFDDVDDYKIIALAKHLELTPQEAGEIEESNDCYNYQGTNYFIGTEEETEERAMDYLTDDTCMYVEWVKQQLNDNNGDSIMNLKDWASWVISMDGYGNTLNSWDGSEDTQEVKGVTYYIIRQ